MKGQTQPFSVISKKTSELSDFHPRSTFLTSENLQPEEQGWGIRVTYMCSKFILYSRSYRYLRNWWKMKKGSIRARSLGFKQGHWTEAIPRLPEGPGVIRAGSVLAAGCPCGTNVQGSILPPVMAAKDMERPANVKTQEESFYLLSCSYQI